MSRASDTAAADLPPAFDAPPVPAGPLRRAFAPGGLALVVFLVSLAVRLAGLDLTLTTDEGYWVQRSIRFGAALVRNDLAGTFRAGHPGVSVMWTGLLGMGFDRASPYFDGRFVAYETLQRAPGYLDALSAARRAMAVVVSALIAGCMLLTWRLVGLGPALAGGALLTLDPYVIGMTRLLHVDALLAPLMAVSVLAGLVAWSEVDGGRRRWPYLLISVVAGGLALLTKAPGAFVGGFLGFACLVAAVRAGRQAGISAFLRTAALMALWGAGVAVVFVGLFPAMWVDPLGRLEYLVRFVQAVGLQPHDGNFFLGQPILNDPGPFYYLVATPLRMSPLVALGLGLLAVPAPSDERRETAWWLAGYVFLFAVFMTMASKKFDRYMLPAIVVADLLAGIGLWRLTRFVTRGWATPASHGLLRDRSRMVLLTGVAAAVVVVQVGLLVRVWPYPIAYYNPLAGGAARAQQLIMVGWGEGLEQVAAYLNGLPDARSLRVVTNYNHVVRPQFVGTTLAISTYLQLEQRARATRPDYVVLYVNGLQRRQITPEVAEGQAAGPPAFVAYVNGQPYAWVYRLPLTGPRPAPAEPLPPASDEPETETQEN